MERYLLDRFATIPGVSQINIFGSGGPSMRVWIDRTALTARNLTVTDIETALHARERRAAGGPHRVEGPRLPGAHRAQLSDGRQLPQSRHRARRRRPLGPAWARSRTSRSRRASTNRIFRTNGALTTGFGIIKASTANTVEVLDAVKAEVDASQRRLARGHGAHHERRRVAVHSRRDRGDLLDDRRSRPRSSAS